MFTVALDTFLFDPFDVALKPSRLKVRDPRRDKTRDWRKTGYQRCDLRDRDFHNFGKSRHVEKRLARFVAFDDLWRPGEQDARERRLKSRAERRFLAAEAA